METMIATLARGLVDHPEQVRVERTDEEWVHLSAVKNLLKRMDPSFSEKALGHKLGCSVSNHGLSGGSSRPTCQNSLRSAMVASLAVSTPNAV